jgi:hypothetical protein
MTTHPIGRPAETEHLPYYSKYISLVPEGDIVETLARQSQETCSLLRTIPPTKADHRYAPDKWTIKEVVGHVIDGERVFAYRALRFARADTTELAGFEENDYVANGSFNDTTLEKLANEFDYLRRANVLFFKHLNDDAWQRRGTANGAEVSVRALAYIIAGHELHHVKLLKTLYLKLPEGA